MKKLYEEFRLKEKHFIECINNKDVLLDKGTVIRVLKAVNNIDVKK
jgi:hypothetical protein